MKEFDLIIIGAGPGGYVGAIRAAQLGLKTAIVEKDKPGGVCLNIGCIPSKALIHQAEKFNAIKDLEKMGVKVDTSGFNYQEVFKKSRLTSKKLSKGVEFLLKKNQVEYFAGEAKFVDAKTLRIDDEEVIKAENIIIATGSRPRQIPGFAFDEEKVLSSTGALMLEKLPERILILGSGAIGMEFTHVMNSFGVEVHLVEMMETLLPTEDADISQELEKAFRKRKVRIYTSTKATGYTETKEGLKVTLEAKDGSTSEVVVDQILVAVGRATNVENIGLEDIGVKTERGFIPVGDYYETDVKGVYAVGDVVASPLLAHVASKEAEIAVEHIAGRKVEKQLDPMLIPGAVYCEPEVGSFGLREKDADPETTVVSRFPYKAIGKATAVEQADGFFKLITDKETGCLLGASIVGAQATELIHELLLAKDMKISMEKVAELIHAHPTLSEGLMEAARMSQGWAIHI
ncbi:MAG TPA: dihydrolipoyl dehydrogenase [Thermotogota bacterium]|nr:dihydrolipoyl dehydrogenase [Thermotogota bacterium]HPJ88029.1 dihydrolipoyl dehydrogenase [Thermotogota bacterium]